MSDHDNKCEFMLAPPDMNRLGLCLCKERALKARLATATQLAENTAAGLAATTTRLAEAERDAARIEWLASNPRGGQIVVDGKTQDCVFWGISGHPRATLRDAIDAARATNSATPRENV